MTARSAAVALMTLALAACERGSQESFHVPSAELVSRFGCEDCGGAAQFSGVQAISVTPSADIAVFDASEPRVRVFDQSGDLRQSFGRSGDGPGEYASAVGITELRDGGFLIVDLARRRAVRVDALGQEMNSVPFGGLPAASSSNEGARDVLVAISSPRDTALRLVRLEEGGSREYGEFGSRFFPPRSENWGALPFAVSPDGLVAIGAGKDSYLIQVFDPEGVPVGAISRDISRSPRTEAEMQAERDAYERRLAQMQAMSPGATFPQPQIPLDRDYFLDDALRYGPDGTLWVKVERAEQGSTTFDLFSPEHEHIGELTLPFRIINYAIGREVLAGVIVDDLDVQSIAVWRVVPGHP